VGLRIQVDAAINPGNSGGPGLVDGKMVGLVCSALSNAENVGFLVPNEEVRAFLVDVADGRYDGPPLLRESFQGLENEALRARLRLGRSDHGVMVSSAPRESGDGPLRPFDVVTKIGPHAIDDEGMVETPAGTRLFFGYFVPGLAGDGTVPLTVLREGKAEVLRVPVSPDPDDLLIKRLDGGRPRYFVCGSLVFSPLVQEAMAAYLQFEHVVARGELAWLNRRQEKSKSPGEEIVVVTSPFLPHKIARGYGEPLGLTLAEVDGHAVKNLRHVAELLRDGEGEFVTFCFAEETAEVLVFRRAELMAATAAVLAENGIPAACSEDLRGTWAGAVAGR
jgi:hypothetical protein